MKATPSGRMLQYLYVLGWTHCTGMRVSTKLAQAEAFQARQK